MPDRDTERTQNPTKQSGSEAVHEEVQVPGGGAGAAPAQAGHADGRLGDYTAAPAVDYGLCKHQFRSRPVATRRIQRHWLVHPPPTWTVSPQGGSVLRLSLGDTGVYIKSQAQQQQKRASQMSSVSKKSVRGLWTFWFRHGLPSLTPNLSGTLVAAPCSSSLPAGVP